MVNQCPVRHTKNGPLQLTIRLISRDSKQTSQQHRSSAPWEHPLQLKTIQKDESEEWKGWVVEKTGRGREFSIDLLHITVSDMRVGSCLLITAQIYTRRLLCHRVPGTICWLLCEKIGQTRAGHFPPNYPHLVVLLQAAWTGKRGKKGESKGKMKDVKKRRRHRGEKYVHQPPNYFVNMKLWKTWMFSQQWGFYIATAVILRVKWAMVLGLMSSNPPPPNTHTHSPTYLPSQ